MQEDTGATEASGETSEAQASEVGIEETPLHAASAVSDEADSPDTTVVSEAAASDSAGTGAGPDEVVSAEPADVVAAAAEPEEPAEPAPSAPEPPTVTEAVVSTDAGDAATSETPSDAAPSAETPAADTSVADTPAADTSVAETPSEPEAASAPPAAEIVFTYQPGDIVPGLITVIGPNGIEADLGEGELAVIPKAELLDGHDPVIGEQIEGTVIRHQAGSGRYVISPKRAHRTRSWTRIEAAFEAGEPVTGVVKATTKGGLILDLGMRAFLPESLIDVRKVHDVASLVGTTMTVKIIECEKITGEQAATERRSEKIVVNRRIMLEAERQAQREALFATVHVGDRRTGTVTALTDFGAFVDIGGGEGLIHVSELAHRQVAKPADVVKVGDTVEVLVLDVKPDRNKISLSRKALLPSPWDQFSQLHKPGDLVFGTVTGLATFGVFVTIEGEGFEPVEGLVHISELSRFRVEQASDVVSVGEGVWSQILSIDPDKRRVALSMRRALE